MPRISEDHSARLIHALRGMEVADGPWVTTSLSRFCTLPDGVFLLEPSERWRDAGFSFGGRLLLTPSWAVFAADREDGIRASNRFNTVMSRGGNYALSSFAVVESEYAATAMLPMLFPHLANPDLPRAPGHVRTPLDLPGIPGGLGIRGSNGSERQAMQVAFSLGPVLHWLTVHSTGLPAPPHEPEEVVAPMSLLHERLAALPPPREPPRPARRAGPPRSRWTRMRRFPVSVDTDDHLLLILDPEGDDPDAFPGHLIEGERLAPGSGAVMLVTESRGGGRYVVEVWPAEPPRDMGDWDEVAECDLVSASGTIQLASLFMDDVSREIPIDPGLHRVRVSCADLALASGIGRGRERYRIQIFPSVQERGYTLLKPS